MDQGFSWIEHIRETAQYSIDKDETMFRHDVLVGDKQYQVSHVGQIEDLPKFREQAIHLLKELFEKAGFTESDVNGGLYIPTWTDQVKLPFRKKENAANQISK